MECNSQNNDEFRCRWNNYKDNNQKSLKGQDHFANFQTAGDSDFINDTEVRFIDKTGPLDRSRCETFWIDTLKTRYPSSLIILTHTSSFCFCSFTSFHRIYGKCLFLFS